VVRVRVVGRALTRRGAAAGLVLHVLSPKLPLYDLMAWTESTPPALISTLAPPYSPFATAFPIKKVPPRPRHLNTGNSGT
jgi:hypothetical protein